MRFSDFADEVGNTFISDDLLGRFPQTAIVKCISKSYGVPGVRLGIMASADKELIADIKT